MSAPDRSEISSSTQRVLPNQTDAQFDTDLSDLATRFSAQSGGGLSPELSADLALEIVLNEIVEQACLATGATGAAIVLERDGEMVCRATSGSTAPELGSRLETSAGLSGECFRTKQTQWCDDVMSDKRVDAKASERLGVRSVVVMPLLRGEAIVGVIELFSSQPYAFGVRDERTLEILADRTLTNLDCVARPLELQKSPAAMPRSLATRSLSPVESQPQKTESIEAGDDVPTNKTGNQTAANRAEKRLVAKEPIEIKPKPAREMNAVLPESRAYGTPAIADRKKDRKQERDQRKQEQRSDGRDVRSGSDGGGWLLGAAAVACAILLGLVMGRHWGSQNALHIRQHVNKSTDVAKLGTDVAPDNSLVSENSKEGLHVPSQSDPAAADQAVGMKHAASLEPDGVMRLSPTTAEDSLLQRVEPEYPEAARQQNIQGAVVLEVHIAADGNVQDIEVISGPPVLAEAATAAVKQWKFKQRLVKGSPVEMQTRVTLNFRLPPQKLPQ